MSRLKDTDKIIDKLNEYTRTNNIEFNNTCRNIIEIINEQPIVFDTDKFLHQCKDKAIELMNKQYIEDEYHMFSKGVQAMYLGVEKIIKEGGLDE